MSTFQIFFTEFSLFGQYPLLTGLDYIRGARSGSKRVFGGYFGASQRSSRVPTFLPSNTFLCPCLCLCPFLPSHFSFVRSLSQPASMAHPAIHFSAINIRVYTIHMDLSITGLSEKSSESPTSYSNIGFFIVQCIHCTISCIFCIRENPLYFP